MSWVCFFQIALLCCHAFMQAVCVRCGWVAGTGAWHILHGAFVTSGGLVATGRPPPFVGRSQNGPRRRRLAGLLRGRAFLARPAAGGFPAVWEAPRNQGGKDQSYDDQSGRARPAPLLRFLAGCAVSIIVNHIPPRIIFLAPVRWRPSFWPWRRTRDLIHTRRTSCHI